MAANKTTQTGADVYEFIATADPKKTEDSKKLIALMERLSGEKAKMWGPSIIGFGSCHYVYESGREGDMPLIGFSPRKASFSLYLSCEADFAKELRSRLGKIKTAVSCIYFKKLADLDMEILEKMILQSLRETREKYG